MSSLSSDRPLVDPKDDLFGHAPFAKSLADSIHISTCHDGLVLSLYGPWGSGKSTVLSFVLHYLNQRPQSEQPLIVTFNPWWFSGHEHLARAFMGQLRAVLSRKSGRFKELGSLLSSYTEGIGGLADLTGYTGGAGKYIGSMLGALWKKTPVDIPALKEQISKLLRQADKRILVIVDDIDRLTPDETRQLFTVIKGLADFPNMIYLLAFDREVAAHAITQTGMPGDRYLEKIIQVPFELPPVDLIALRGALFHKLNEITTDTPDGLSDSEYWTNVYYDGLDALFNVPRDVVRFINTLSVTYPSVRGEVNAVDFCALEALRVFTPSLYDTIRTNIELFAGHGSSDESRKKRESILKAPMEDLPPRFRTQALELLERLFPKLERTTYGADWLSTWRKALRVCHPDLSEIYFRFSVPPGVIRRSEVERVLQLATSPATLRETFLDAVQQKRLDGLSKARGLLERLRDHVESDIPQEHVPVFISVLMDVGDQLLIESDNQGGFDSGNDVRILRLIYHLLKRVPAGDRLHVLKTAIKAGNALYIQSSFLYRLIKEAEKESPEHRLTELADLETMTQLWIDKVRSQESRLLHNEELPYLLHCWRTWGNADEVRAWCEEAASSTEGLLAFLKQFITFSTSNTMGDWAVKKRMRLNPKAVEVFLDIPTVVKRVNALKDAKEIPAASVEYVDTFLREVDMVKEGKDPDSPWADE